LVPPGLGVGWTPLTCSGGGWRWHGFSCFLLPQFFGAISHAIFFHSTTLSTIPITLCSHDFMWSLIPSTLLTVSCSRTCSNYTLVYYSHPDILYTAHVLHYTLYLVLDSLYIVHEIITPFAHKIHTVSCSHVCRMCPCLQHFFLLSTYTMSLHCTALLHYSL
jgi:hypothetical protein